MATIKPWFPTFIYEAALGGLRAASLNRDLLSDALKVRDKDVAGQRWSAKSYPAGFTSYASMSQLHQTFSTFMDLKKRLQPHVQRFARRLDMDLDGGRLEMTDCWVNVMPRFAVHSLHLHPLSVISGTYYVKTPRGASPLRFEDPRMDKFMGAPCKLARCRPENRPQISHEAKAGHLVLFESWLRHEVAPNRIAGERVSISFNYAWIRP